MARLSNHLRKDLVDLGKEVYKEDVEQLAPSVIRTKMDEEPKIDPINLREFDPITMSDKGIKELRSDDDHILLSKEESVSNEID